MEHQKSTVNREITHTEQDDSLIIIELSFSQEIIIAVSFIVTGFILLLFTEPDMNLLLPSPFNDILLLFRAIVNSILLLFIPGFALTNLLFQDYKTLDFIERIALSCGLSISIIIIAGFILASGEINAFSIFFIITSFTLVFIAIRMLLIRYTGDRNVSLGKDRLISAIKSMNFFKMENVPRTINISDYRVKDWRHDPPITGLIEYYRIKSHYVTLLYTITVSFVALLVALLSGKEINPDNSLFVLITAITAFFLFFAQFLHLSSHLVKPAIIVFLSTLIFTVVAWFLVSLIVIGINIFLPTIALDFNLVFIICILFIYEIEIAQVYFHIEDSDDENNHEEINNET
ncbi:MAG: DUF1616 domain-containing protein [Candidatus Hodarchaeales archaeon]